MKDDRLPESFLFGQPFRAKRKAGCPRLGWEDVIKKNLKKIVISWEGVKRKALNKLGWRRTVHSCVSLRGFCSAVSYY